MIAICSLGDKDAATIQKSDRLSYTMEKSKSSDELEEPTFQVYKRRWFVLATVAMLNISINILWISFSSVASSVAYYYEVSPTNVDLLSAVGFLIGLPVCLISTWMVDKLGLRFTVTFANVLTFLGGLIRCVSTFPGLEDSFNKDIQYWCAVAAQVLVGIANPLGFCLPTKVAQDWFPPNEVALASGIITLSFVLGVTMGNAITPFVITSKELVPYLNLMWFIPSIITLILGLFSVNRSKPITPPSKSSAAADSVHIPFGKRLKMLLTNKNFLVLVLSVGGAIGFFNAIISQLQQLMCARGYEVWFSGLCGALVLLSGIVGGGFSTFVATKTGKLEETAKIALSVGVILIILILELLRKSGMDWGIAISLVIGGFIAFGILPLGMELSEENTYPLESSTGITIINVSAQLQGLILIAVSGFLDTDLVSSDLEIQTCTSDDQEPGAYIVKPKDKTHFLMLLMCHITLVCLIFVLGLKSEFKRRDAENMKLRQTRNSFIAQHLM